MTKQELNIKSFADKVLENSFEVETKEYGRISVVSEDTIVDEIDKFVKKIDTKTAITNREHLNTLDDMHFAIVVFAKVSELQLKNNNPEDDIWEIVNDTQMDFEDWLKQEYEEQENNE